VTTTTVRVRYFAALREALGEGEAATLVSSSSPVTVAGLRDHLIGRSEAHALALGRAQLVRCAVDQVVCAESAVLHDQAEVAFFPPVTGG
jgi:molybdopterin synthase sulfur carrier subunit